MTKNYNNSANNLIKKCGGSITVARWCGLNTLTVRYWGYPKEKHGTGGRIPLRHRSTILYNAMLAGIEITPADFN